MILLNLKWEYVLFIWWCKHKIRERDFFGSTTKRFEGVGDHIIVAPPIGVYDIEEVIDIE